ncbi:MAG: Glutamate-1-semialdehyde 2,1-aminomutase [Chlamydiales bacterium]|nr:Glutamate-1-semialdehyde 2,1-aminomutase [Chlamydiales bacterium]MCH9620132.1 Glutamate-1-semialdehyde 2,1-aminomutase [Chlamydiales bacterium]MCH9623602.1 Glutamate-1-semialdehyde 2,1-aminomutase [Chlamydiales bacterium]
MTIIEKKEAKIPLRRPKSEHLYTEASTVMPTGVSSPVRAFPGLDQTPLVVEAGYLDEIQDVDGYRYIDYCCSWGALIHGHAPSLVVEAAQKQIAKGSSFGITTPIEGKLAAKICELIPSVEKVRFVSSGTEATMTALRLARGYTGRELLIKFTGNYHGHGDAFLVQAGSGAATFSTSSSAGVPHDVAKNTITIPYNDIEALRAVLKRQNVAAVIIEPVAANMGVIPPKEGFLQAVREETAKNGALLIFDEVITGFRVGIGGAEKLYGITPDLSCFGKIIGGGFAAAAFAGRAEVMDHLSPAGNVYHAGTLSGNPVAMEAGLQTLRLLEAESFYHTLEAKTRLITDPICEEIEKRQLNCCLHQVGSLFTLFFGQREVSNLEDVKGCDFAKFNDYFKFAFQKGVYLSPSQYEANFVSMAHTTPHLEYTRDVILEYLNGPKFAPHEMDENRAAS